MKNPFPEQKATFSHFKDNVAHDMTLISIYFLNPLYPLSGATKMSKNVSLIWSPEHIDGSNFELQYIKAVLILANHRNLFKQFVYYFVLMVLLACQQFLSSNLYLNGAVGMHVFSVYLPDYNLMLLFSCGWLIDFNNLTHHKNFIWKMELLCTLNSLLV